MIMLYSGTPGSGKSLHAAKTIVEWSKRGKGVICNFPVNLTHIKRVKTKPVYMDNSEITVKALTDYAKRNHVVGKESQTLVVIDEAQVLYNSRSYIAKNRTEWCTFFSQHRHYGFDFILIAQFDRMLDRQIRCLIETEYKHRKLNNYGIGGTILQLATLNSAWFICIEYWYGGNKLKLGSEIFKYRKTYGEVYDTFAIFDEGSQLETEKFQENLPPAAPQKKLIDNGGLLHWLPPYI